MSLTREQLAELERIGVEAAEKYPALAPTMDLHRAAAESFLPMVKTLQAAHAVLILCDSELSAIAYGRPPSSKENLLALAHRCREIYGGLQ